MSALALLINLVALAIYSYAVYSMNSLTLRDGMKAIIPPQLQVYGQLKFLTFQCLLIQLFSSALHVVAHFVRFLRPLRDLVFTTLAYPVGSIVVYTFWAVWIFLGRELIFPERLDSIYPPWLNHSTHTIIAPINILLAILMHHKYTKNGFLITLLHSGLYTVFLHVIKAQTGLFVYGYLEKFNETERMIYFASTGIFAYLMYKSGQALTYAVHGGGPPAKQQEGIAGKQQRKQKQR